MAAAAGRSSKTAAEAGPSPNLEADIRQLREDVAKLAEQLATTKDHSYSAARRAAAEGVEQLRTQGEAAIEGLRANANDIQEQVIATVREKPVTSLAIAAGVGFLFALLSRR